MSNRSPNIRFTSFRISSLADVGMSWTTRWQLRARASEPRLQMWRSWTSPTFGTCLISRVTSADVQRVAKQYVPADKVTVLIVGDLAKIRAGVEALTLGPSRVIGVERIVR